MKFTKLLLTLFMLTSIYSYAQDYQSTYYISPGCRISWDLKSSIILGLKISFGRMVSEEYYYNITIGKKFLLIDKSNNIYQRQIYIDLQTGSFLNHYPFSAGIGLGAAIIAKSNEKKLYPRLTIFSGAGLFCTLDYLYKMNLIDLGFQAVLPLAFYENYRKFNQ